MDVLDAKSFNTKAEMVYEQLKENIISGFFEQGKKIIAREIAKQVGISDIPVREALKKLESEGLVENIPHVGTRVVEFNLQKAAEIFMIRLELEAFATRLAALHADVNALNELQELVDCMNQAIQEEDCKQIGRLNRKFHQSLYKLSGNATLYEIIVSLMERSEISRAVFVLLPERKKQSNLEHQMIVNALRDGNGEEAEKILRAQKSHAFAALLNKLELGKGEEKSKKIK
jgi:DNA-binding GntR family transcriptional regulator